jgi:hypothetical protein
MEEFPCVVLYRGFAYSPFDNREQAQAWCAHNLRRNVAAKVLPLNNPYGGVA